MEDQFNSNQEQDNKNEDGNLSLRGLNESNIEEDQRQGPGPSVLIARMKQRQIEGSSQNLDQAVNQLKNLVQLIGLFRKATTLKEEFIQEQVFSKYEKEGFVVVHGKPIKHNLFIE